MQDFLKTFIDKAYSYREYREQIENLLSEGKTTGLRQTEKLVDISKLNIQRMKRIDKTVTVLPELTGIINNFERNCVWLVIAEAWCGDVAQNLPVINKIAESTSCVKLKIVLRDENPELIDRYLTNGGQAIPKLICIDSETMEEICTWGPRPQPAQEMMREHKANHVTEHSEVLKDIQLWYAHDKGVTVQKEIMKLIQKCGFKEDVKV